MVKFIIAILLVFGGLIAKVFFSAVDDGDYKEFGTPT